MQPRQLGLDMVSSASEGSAMKYLPQSLIGIAHPGLSIASIIYYNIQRSSAFSEGLLVNPCFAAESSRENTEGFAGTTKPSISSACQLPLSQQAYPMVCSDYQPSVYSPGAAISQTDQLGREQQNC